MDRPVLAAQLSTVRDFTKTAPDLAATLQKVRAIGYPAVQLSGVEAMTPAEDRAMLEREAVEVGRRLREEGLSFSYHNHAFEFAHFDGARALDILYDESDPALLQAEIDTYWVQYGGGDPAAWIRKVAGRMPVVHLKDMVIQDNRQVMAEVGAGNLKWPAILEACREAGVEWYAVEQDICQRDPFESLAISYANLREMGLR